MFFHYYDERKTDHGYLVCMKQIFLLVFIYIFVGLFLGSCEKVSFPDPETGGGKPTLEDTLVVDTTGAGTLYAPATVVDILKKPDEYLGFSCWVAGYIVGYTERTIKNAAFTVEGAVQSNILLAQYPWEQDYERCIPVELKTGKWKQNISLAHRPENLGKRIAVHGLIKTYFSVTGVRSIDGANWLENESFPDEPDEPQLPEEPDEPQQPDEPEEPALPDEPEEPENPIETYFIFVNDLSLQQVNQKSVISVGERYMLGTVPEYGRMAFVGLSLKYGKTMKYRSVLLAEGEHDRFYTEERQMPAIFLLEQSENGFRLRDELTGGYLAYDVRGDATSISWLPLYTLLSEDLDDHFCADFLIHADETEKQLETSEKIKFSVVDSRNGWLRYNSGGMNFKLNYTENGGSVCLYLLK